MTKSGRRLFVNDNISCGSANRRIIIANDVVDEKSSSMLFSFKKRKKSHLHLVGACENSR